MVKKILSVDLIPLSRWSSPVILAPKTLFFGQIFLKLLAISKRSLVLLIKLPPYWSFLLFEIGEKNFDSVLFLKSNNETPIIIGSVVFTSIEELAGAVLSGISESGADYIFVGIAGDADPADMPVLPEGLGVLSFADKKGPVVVKIPQALKPESSDRSGLLEELLVKLL